MSSSAPVGWTLHQAAFAGPAVILDAPTGYVCGEKFGPSPQPVMTAGKAKDRERRRLGAPRRGGGGSWLRACPYVLQSLVAHGNWSFQCRLPPGYTAATTAAGDARRVRFFGMALPARRSGESTIPRLWQKRPGEHAQPCLSRFRCCPTRRRYRESATLAAHGHQRRERTAAPC